MTVRRLIINGDSGWNFREMVWAHALDLYPIQKRVGFADCVKSSGKDMRDVIGNFPEDYSIDYPALSDEIETEILLLKNNPKGYLSVTTVVSAQDMELVAGHSGPWREAPGLSETGLAALNALATAAVTLANQTDLDGEVARISTRVWLNIVVREAGSKYADGEKATKLLAALKEPNVIIHNVFLLSNGTQNDATDIAATEHFAKLRFLIDLFDQTETPDAWKQFRRSTDMGLHQTSAFFAVRFPAGERRWPVTSAVLRTELIRQFRALGATQGTDSNAGVTEFSDTVRQIEAMVPSLQQDSYSLHRALAAIEPDFKSRIAELEQETEVRESLTDERDVTEVIAELRSSRFKGFFFDISRQNRLTEVHSKYESAFQMSKHNYGAVVDKLIVTQQEFNQANQTSLSALVRDLVLPGSGAGQEKVKEFRERLKIAETETSELSSNSRRALANLSAISADGAKEREEAFDILQGTERNLLNFSAMRTPVGFAMLIFLPIIVFFGGSRSAGGAGRLNSTFVMNELGPVLYIVLISFVLSSLAGLLFAFRAKRKRDGARKQTVDRLEANYKALQDIAGARLTIAENRRRSIDISTVLSQLNPVDNLGTLDNAEDFIGRLTALDQPIVFTEAISKEKSLRMVQSSALAFGQGKTRAEKILAFLGKSDAEPSGILSIASPQLAQKNFEFSSSATSQLVQLEFGAPGNG